MITSILAIPEISPIIHTVSIRLTISPYVPKCCNWGLPVPQFNILRFMEGEQGLAGQHGYIGMEVLAHQLHQTLNHLESALLDLVTLSVRILSRGMKIITRH